MAKRRFNPFIAALIVMTALVSFACNNPTPTPTPDPTPTPSPTPTPTPTPVPSGTLSLTMTEANLPVFGGQTITASTVTIVSGGQFELVFEEADNWGLSQWYDLVNDPGLTTNLTGEQYGSACPNCSEPGLFQEVFYGSNPDDVKLFSRALYYFPNTPRSLYISENSASRVVLTTTSQPMTNDQGVDTNITVAVTYTIYPNGKIYVQTTLSMLSAETITEWRMATLGLEDPTATDATASSTPDTQGWMRSTATQNPYSYTVASEPYIYAYWNPNTPAPYANFTQASVMLVPNPSNPNPGHQGVHGWDGWKRWYYGQVPLSLSAGGTITQEYMIQLGTTGSQILPDLNTNATAGPIAAQYISNPTPP